MSNVKQAMVYLTQAKKVAIFTHMRPDGDCLGSALALKLILEKQGKKADVYGDVTIKDNYYFLPAVDTINHPQLNEYDLCVAVDCSDRFRLGDTLPIFEKGERTLKIDHHKTNDQFAQVDIVEMVGSTAEIMFDLFQQLKWDIDQDIATCLYAGVSSDTGCFLYNSTTKKTHEIACELLKHNLDLEKIHYYLFQRRTKEQVLLTATALKNIEFFLNDKVAFTGLSLKDFDRIGAASNDTLGIVSMIANIDGCRIAILMGEEKPNTFAISFRTDGSVDVSLVAEKFGGGGHKMAAGCKIYGNFETVKAKLIDACREFVC